jgi:large subunit ribosomal protein L24
VNQQRILTSAAIDVQNSEQNMARHIKSGEQVMIIAGADKGKVGRVLRLVPDKDRVVVEGINRVWKHVRPTQRNPQGGRIQKDAPIHISNVMPLDPTTGKGTRVRFEQKDGVKHRIAVKSGTDLGRTGKK